MRAPKLSSRAALRSPAPKTFVSVIALGLMLLALATVRLPESTRAAEDAPSVVTVNAASYTGPLAPGSIAAAFGVNLAASTNLADQVPLPTELAGSSARLMDSENVEHSLSLFFVSPGQINFLMPDDVALGQAQIVITREDGTSSRGPLEIAQSSPAMFTALSNGRGAPVAMTTYDGLFYEAATNNDGTPRAVDPGTVWRPNYLVVFGTGLRHATNLRARIGGIEVEPLYSGPQGSFAGLDQINLPIPPNAPAGVVDFTLNTPDRVSNTVQLRLQGEAVLTSADLTENDVQTIIAQAVTKAQQVGARVTVAVTDHEGNVLGVFKMNGTRADTVVGIEGKPAGGLQGVSVPATFAAISKAGTAAFFSTHDSAFTTRTASFVIQEHFPPGVELAASGPFFGVQFSQLPCTDIKLPSLPLGLAGDPGGVPLYKNGVAVGGVGIEGDGAYTVDTDPNDNDQPIEELIAVAAMQGYEAPSGIRADGMMINGFRLPFANTMPTEVQAAAFSSLTGTVDPLFPVRAAQASRFSPLTLGGVPGRIDSRFFPFKNSPSMADTKLTAAEVTTIITQAAQEARRTRAALRLKLGLGAAAQVNIAVVDASGVVLGVFSTVDAPIFGFDVSVQKARTAAFYSHASAANLLRSAEGGRFAKYVEAAVRDGVRLDGAFALTDRASSLLSRPFFPDGNDGSANGPFSKPITEWSPFNDGLQLDLVTTALTNVLSGKPAPSCTGIPNLPNGIQIFAGSVPLYKNGVLVGALGISGDGVEQESEIAATGVLGFEAPEGMRSDQIVVRGVTLPWIKPPRRPNQ